MLTDKEDLMSKLTINDAFLCHANYFVHILSELSNQYQQNGNLSEDLLYKLNRKWDQIIRGLNWCIDNATNSSEALHKLLQYAAVSGPLFILKYPPNEHIDLLENVLSLIDEENSEDEKISEVKAVLLISLGTRYRDIGEFQKSINCHLQALAIAQKINNEDLETSALTNTSVVLKYLGDFVTAESLFNKALQNARSRNNLRVEALVLMDMGVLRKNQGRAEESIEYHLEALEIFNNIGDALNQAKALGNLGNSYYVLKNPEKSIEYSLQSLALGRKLGSKRSEAISLHNLSGANLLLENYTQALDYESESLKIFEDIGDNYNIAHAYWRMSDIYIETDDVGKAIRCLVDAERIFKRINHPAKDAVKQELMSWIGTYGEKGTNFDLSHEPAQVLSFRNIALEISRVLEDETAESWNLGEIGAAYVRIDNAEAFSTLQKALAIAKKTHHRRLEGQHLANIGMLYRCQRDFKKAIYNVEKALQIDKKHGNSSDLLYDYKNLGDIYHDSGDHQKAIYYYEIAAEIFDKSNSPEINLLSGLLLTLGHSYNTVGNFDNAEKTFTRGLFLCRKNNIVEKEKKFHYQLATVFLKQGGDKIKRSINEFKDIMQYGISIGDDTLKGLCLRGIGEAYSLMGKMDSGIKHLEQAHDIFSIAEDIEREAQTCLILTRAYIKDRQIEKAQNIAQRGLDLSKNSKNLSMKIVNQELTKIMNR